MRKNKTWLVDLFSNDSPMRKQPATQIGNDDFWTSDTEAYLNFAVSTQEFTIDTAKINLYNKDDGTLVQRDMTIENNEAQYELPQEIIAHFGKWNAQVVFISGTERYTSPMVDFEVKRTLGDGAPEKLGIIRDWIVFESDAKELIATVEANEQVRNTNEASRIADENVRKVNEEERELNEAERISKDSERDGKIEGLQSDFDSLDNMFHNTIQTNSFKVFFCTVSELDNIREVYFEEQPLSNISYIAITDNMETLAVWGTERKTGVTDNRFQLRMRNHYLNYFQTRSHDKTNGWGDWVNR